MAELRTVSVLEHQVVPIFVSAEEADGIRGPWFTEDDSTRLLQLNETRRGFCQRVAGGVKLAQHCGVIKLPSCILEVLPKVGFDGQPDEAHRARITLLAMLRTSGCVPITSLDSVGQSLVKARLIDIFIRAFLFSALDQSRRGLLSRYVQHRDDTEVVRGRFDTHAHFRRNIARPHLLHCEYDEFTVDNPFNQAIRATLAVCKPWISDSATEHLWFETHTRFANISNTRIRAKDVDRLRSLDRTTRRYDQVLTWCSWLLALESPSIQAGAPPAPGLLFDMNKVFEAHVCTLVESDEARIIHRQGPKMALARRGAMPVFYLRPDVTVWGGHAVSGETRVTCIIDAKWKRLDPHADDLGIAHADVYQVLAYAHRYGCTEVELAYPWTEDMGPVEKVQFDISSAYSSSQICVRVRLIPVQSSFGLF